MTRKGFPKYLLLFLLICTASASSVFAQQIKSYISSDSLTVGEIFTFSITANKSDTDQVITFPNPIIFPEIFEIVDFEQFSSTDNQDSAAYTLQFFGNSDTQVPSLPLFIKSGNDSSMVFSDAKMIYFKSILEVDVENADLKPLKDIFDFPLNWWLILFITALIAALAYYLYLRFYKNRPEPEEKEAIVIPDFNDPIHNLKDGLHQINEKFTAQVEKDYKWFYSSLGDELRLYLEETYKIPALESTTRELMRYMDAFGVDQQMTTFLRNIMKEADLVKFAKVKPTYEEALKAFENAQYFTERAEVVDAMRIHRMKAEFEKQFLGEE